MGCGWGLADYLALLPCLVMLSPTLSQSQAHIILDPKIQCTYVVHTYLLTDPLDMLESIIIVSMGYIGSLISSLSQYRLTHTLRQRLLKDSNSY